MVGFESFDIKERNFIVTGASGHLGFELTEALCANGCNVLALIRNNRRVYDLSPRYPNLTIQYVDLLNESQTRSVISQFSQEKGNIHGLFNNAYSASKGVSLNADKELIHQVFDSTFVQYWTTARIAIQYFDFEKGGSIVNNGSLFGNLAPNLSMYLDLKNEPSMSLVVAKGAVHQLTRYMAAVLAERNIRVNTLVPGFFPQKRGPERLDYLDQITSRLMIKRIGRPEDLIGPLVFLLSEASRYMTGSELIIDGGYSAM